MSEAPAKKMIVLMSCDIETFEVEEAAAVLSQIIKHLIDDDCADTVIPISNLIGNILPKVLECCKKHVVDDSAAVEKFYHEDEVKMFDKDFVNVDIEGTLFDLIMATDYLDIKSLLDLTCQKVADIINFGNQMAGLPPLTMACDS